VNGADAVYLEAEGADRKERGSENGPPLFVLSRGEAQWCSRTTCTVKLTPGGGWKPRKKALL
jgi:hypothetical protein